ncbi:MAG: sulfatase-like hydrolase/transferase [Bacteroidetes bacterium]|nr:sulfatase-like hydrolase/transferase [Fibrella sp.]
MRILLLFLTVGLGQFLLTLEPHFSSPAPSPPFQPNIIWIVADDMSLTMGCYGDSVARTPNLDRLATESTRYTQVFSVHGACSPSRAALITGMYPTSIGAHHMRTTGYGPIGQPPYEAVPAPSVKCFSEYLRGAGYYCTNNEKTDYQFSTPFTAWDESSARAHWRNRQPGQPFFAVFTLMDTHAHFIWERADSLQTDPQRVKLPPYYPDTDSVRRDVARQYDNVRRIDERAGQILRQLTEDGLSDNTYVVFLADNGQGLARSKRFLYDSGIQVPLLIRTPDRARAGKTDNRLISFVDFAPTMLSLAGLRPPSAMQGQAFTGEYAQKPRNYIFAATDRIGIRHDRVRVVRSARFKYVRNYHPELPFNHYDESYSRLLALHRELYRLHGEGKLNAVQELYFRPRRPREELFDVVNDPHEIHDLAADPRYRTELATLRGEHERWVSSTGDLGIVLEKELIERFWPGGKQPQTASPTVTRISESANLERVQLQCATPGASIGYRLGDQPGWAIYTKPFAVQKGTSVQAKAIRIGYALSPANADS